MSLDAIAAVRSRMSTIEARFDSWSPTSTSAAMMVGTSTPALGADFEATLRSTDQPTSPFVATADTGPSRAVPVISAASRGVESLRPSAATPVAWARPTTPLASEGMVDPATPYAEVFDAAGAAHGVPPRLLAAVGYVESAYQTHVVSPDGAIGVMQLMPEVATSLGVDPRDPVGAIDGAARLLADHHRRFGSWDLALGAYFSGPGAIKDAGGTLPPRAAQYVSRVHARLEET